MRGEIMCKDLIAAFRPHTICSWIRSTFIDWRDLLTQRGVYIISEGARPPAESIIDLLYHPRHIARAPYRNTNHNDAQNHPNGASEPELDDVRYTSDGPISAHRNIQPTLRNTTQYGAPTHHHYHRKTIESTATAPPEDPGNGSSSFPEEYLKKVDEAHKCGSTDATSRNTDRNCGPSQK